MKFKKGQKVLIKIDTSHYLYFIYKKLNFIVNIENSRITSSLRNKTYIQISYKNNNYYIEENHIFNFNKYKLKKLLMK